MVSGYITSISQWGNGCTSLHGTTRRICPKRLQQSLLPPQQITIQIKTRGPAVEQWLHKVLTKLNFTRAYSDASLYIYTCGDIKIIIPVFMDDMTLMSKSEQALECFIMELGKHFK